MNNKRHEKDYKSYGYCIACGKVIKHGDNCILTKTENNNFLILCMDEIERFGYKPGQYKIIKYGIKEIKPKILKDTEKENIEKYIRKNRRISGWMKKNKLFYDYALTVVEKIKQEKIIKKEAERKKKMKENRKKMYKNNLKTEYNNTNTIFNYLSDEQKKMFKSDKK